MRRSQLPVYCFILGLFSAALANAFPPVPTLEESATATPSGPLFAAGEAIAVSGDTVAIRTELGEVHIFEPNGGSIFWQETAILTASSPDSEAFGHSLALDGDRLAIGDFLFDDQGIVDAGAIFIYERDGAGPWQEVDVITHPAPSTGARFSQYLDLQGDLLVARAHVGGASSALHEVVVFQRDSVGTWLQMSDDSMSTLLALATDGERVIAGSRGAFSGRGEVRVYEDFLQSASIVGPTPFTHFAESAAIDGDTLVVGSPIIAQKALIYERTGGTWQVAATLSAPQLGDRFGSQVAVQDDLVAISAYGAAYLGTAGSVYIYQRDLGGPGAWGLYARLESRNPILGAQFGWRLDFQDRRLVVGEQLVGNNRVHIFDLRPGGLDLVLSGGEICRSTPDVDLVASVTAPDAVTSIFSQVNGVPTATICTICGFNPVEPFQATLTQSCDNTITALAADVLDGVGSDTTVVRFDPDPPEMTCPDDIFVNLPFPDASSATVNPSTPTAIDACDGSLTLPCRREDEDFVFPGEEDQYRPGTTHTACRVFDSCNNFGACGFDITVFEHGVALPAEGCKFFEFRDNQLLEGGVPGFVPVKLGDATKLFENVSPEGIELETNGSSLGPAEDNAGFLSRQVAGDFRVEMPLPIFLGGGSAPKGGLMVRWGLDSDAPRAMAMLLPGPTGGTIEFRARLEAGVGGQALATSIAAENVTDLAFEIEGERVTAQYSIDHGESWLTPGGALGGAASFTFFGDAYVGPAASSGSIADTTFVFPYIEICPILGVDPGETQGESEGCRNDDFEDESLDADWTLVGVGNANQVSAEEAGGALAFTADGATAFAGADNAGFLYKSMRGDFRAEVTVDGSGMSTGGAFRKAGLMVRESLDPLAPRLLAQLVPFWNGSTEESHLQFVARETQGGPGNMAIATDVVGSSTSARLAIERRGDEFRVQYSLDGGATWTTPSGGLGGQVTLALPETILVGLDVVSNDISVTSTASFDDFTLCPFCLLDDFDDGVVGSAWTFTGLGNANQLAIDESGGLLELTSDGATAFSGADNAGFLYRQVTGDFRAEVTVDGEGMTTGGPYRKTGLMVRTSLNPWAQRLIAQLVPYWNNGTSTHLQFVARVADDALGNTAVARDVVGVPRQVRLAVERSGDTLSVEYSIDGGLTWVQPTTGLGGSVTMPLPETLLLGLDMVSNNISVTSTSQFDNFMICQ